MEAEELQQIEVDGTVINLAELIEKEHPITLNVTDNSRFFILSLPNEEVFRYAQHISRIPLKLSVYEQLYMDL